MSRQQYEADCPGCRPALLDTRTGRAFPDDSPEMQAVMTVWSETTRYERQAWHNVTCQNSRVPADVMLAEGFALKIQAALARIPDGS